ncbi:MAG: amidohydrolase family protein [Chitinophagaceae bacterium]
MEILDSHQHFWKYDPGRQSWMNNEMEVLKKDYGPEDLSLLLDECQIQGSIAIQASQTEEENEFLLDLADKYSFIKGVVGWVDLQSISVSEMLSYYHTKINMKGFRHVIHDEPDIDFMLRPAFLHGMKALRFFGYTYDLLIYPFHLPNALSLVRHFPDQPFVIDHIAKPKILENEIAEWRKSLTLLASLPNVYCKISGMATEAVWKKWKQADFIPYLDAVVELFGTKRILYGSDWPVCTLSASYAETYGIVKNYFDSFSDDEQRDFFGLNAKTFYKL